ATDTFKMLADDPTRTVVVADPRETETTRTATRHLRVRPGSDVWLLLALAAVIVREGLLGDALRAALSVRVGPPRAEAAAAGRARRGGRRRHGATLRPHGRRDRRDGARLRRRRVGRDLLRPGRRAVAVLDAERVPDPRAADAHRQHRADRRRRVPGDVPRARR